MAPTRQPTDGWALAMRWGARILALIACGLFALFAVQKGVIVLPKLEVGQLQGWPLLLVLLAALLGVIIAWRWEVAGASSPYSARWPSSSLSSCSLARDGC